LGFTWDDKGATKEDRRMTRETLGRTKDLHIHIRPEDYAAAKRVADHLGQTMPTFIERALREAARRYAKKIPQDATSSR
jgi:hypothetical protein